MLRCADGSFYTGITRDIERRLEQHRKGEGAIYTRRRRPVRIVFVEEYPDPVSAAWRERRIKGMSRRKKEALCKAWSGIKSRHCWLGGTKRSPPSFVGLCCAPS